MCLYLLSIQNAFFALHFLSLDVKLYILFNASEGSTLVNNFQWHFFCHICRMKTGKGTLLSLRPRGLLQALGCKCGPIMEELSPQFRIHVGYE